jgi:putative transposase
MEEDTVVGLPRPGGMVEDDPLLAVLREGARQMLTHAIEAEVAAFLAVHADRVDEEGRRRVVRHGHAPKRALQTGIGPIEVRRPRVRDRGADDESTRIRFTSAVLPAYLRRARNVEELLPWLYLKGISTGQFEEALTVLLGPDAPGLSAATIRRLVSAWQDEHQRWQGRDLSAKRYVYVWADGVYFAPRLEHDRQCMLVLIGADAGGKKELLAIDDGFRESGPPARRERSGHRPRARHRRRRPRFLEGGQEGLADRADAALLGPRDGERAELPAEISAEQGQGRSPRDLRGREPGRRRRGVRSFLAKY